MACAKRLHQIALCMLLLTLVMALVEAKDKAQPSFDCITISLFCNFDKKCRGPFVKIYNTCQDKQRKKVTCEKKECKEAAAAAKDVEAIANFRKCTCDKIRNKKSKKGCEQLKQVIMCNASA